MPEVCIFAIPQPFKTTKWGLFVLVAFCLNTIYRIKEFSGYPGYIFVIFLPCEGNSS